MISLVKIVTGEGNTGLREVPIAGWAFSGAVTRVGDSVGGWRAFEKFAQGIGMKIRFEPWVGVRQGQFPQFRQSGGCWPRPGDAARTLAPGPRGIIACKVYGTRSFTHLKGAASTTPHPTNGQGWSTAAPQASFSSTLYPPAAAHPAAAFPPSEGARNGTDEPH